MVTKPGYDDLGPNEPLPALLVPRPDGAVEVRSPILRRLLGIITAEGTLVIKRERERVALDLTRLHRRS